MHEYQRYSVDWIEAHPYSGLFLDMGLGKTLATLTGLHELMKDFEVIDKVLVIAPLKVAQSTWPAEIHKWDQFSDFTYSVVTGTPNQRMSALAEDVDIYITNRESVVWLTELYGKKWPFKTVVIDELSSFKSTRSKRFKALRKVRPLMERVIGLTGTPAPNTLLDLWPQLYLLDRGKRLGRTVTQYRNDYFYPGQASGHVVYSWNLQNGAEDAIYDRIGDICVSMKKADHLKLPARTDEVVTVSLSAKEREVYDTMERDYVLNLNQDEIVAANAAVLANKLLQLASGAIYDEDGKALPVHEAKLEALDDLIEQANGQPVLVFYNFKHDRERIMKRHPEAVDLTSEVIDDWNAGKIPVLLAHPQSSGHGLNLQAGGHIIVWFSLTWSLEYYQQANARLDRQGQSQPVTVYHLVTENTVDERVMKVLQGKAKSQDELLAAVKAQIKKARVSDYD
ncbi:DEAD/DEAH box helicase [Secundilactobacillus kimchicus]|uniref:DEAD/DEAH box helicase n=1 Tax=Secundilactobacillus kimchicus TaxID=528209 RepID=UPI0030B8FF65